MGLTKTFIEVQTALSELCLACWPQVL